jgi:NAD(P)H-nitrite reductase large subunit
MTKDTSFTIDSINMSLVSEEEKQSIFALLRKYNVPLTQITPAQKLVLFGVEELSRYPLLQELDNLISDMGYEKKYSAIQIHSLRCCPDQDKCKYSIASSIKLGRIINCLTFSRPFPHKVKVAISGCSMCCTEPLVRDIGIVANRKGWNVYFGGNGGGKPRIADLVASYLDDEQVVTIVTKLLTFYAENATKRQRTARFVELIGIDVIKKNIL